MSTIVTRAGKGSSLTWEEGDANITNLNNDKVESVVGAWTPVDGSGASLVFSSATGRYVKLGKLVTIWGRVTYPVTASTAFASIGNAPFVSKANALGLSYYAGSIIGPAGVDEVAVSQGTDDIGFYLNDAFIQNSVLSNQSVQFCISYEVD